MADCHSGVSCNDYSAAGTGKDLRPKLILVLSVDQMRYDYLTRLGAAL